MCREARGRGRAWKNACARASRSRGLILLMKRARSCSMWVTRVLNRGWYGAINLYAEAECSHLLSRSKSLSSAITSSPLCLRLKVSSHFSTDDPRWSLTPFVKKKSSPRYQKEAPKTYSPVVSVIFHKLWFICNKHVATKQPPSMLVTVLWRLQ